MYALKIRGKIFIFENKYYPNLENVVYRITTDKNLIYIGYTTTSLIDRCTNHCINFNKQKKTLQTAIYKSAKVDVLYQIGESNIQKLKEIESYAIYQTICKILDEKNILYENNKNIFKLNKHFNNILLNKKIDINNKDLLYIIEHPNELNLEMYSKISIPFLELY